MTSSGQTQIAVIGAGLSGLLAAIALSDDRYGAGRSVVLIDGGDIERDGTDGRATALTPSAMRMLERLGITVGDATPMMGMRVGEGDPDTPWQFELPERSGEPLGFIVENAELRSAFLQRLKIGGVVLRSGTRVETLDTNGHLTVSDGLGLEAALIVAADGRNSTVRRLADISVSDTDFRQSALVTTVQHAEPHDGIALQRFQAVGAVASLPLATRDGNHRSQIVWSDRHEAVAAACTLDSDALVRLIDERLWGALEVTALDAPVQSYPLLARRSETLSRGRVALIGDAARTIHPLAGQGFNLAVRDVAALVDGVRAAASTGQDVGSAGLLGYERWRRTDETVLAGLTTALAQAPDRGLARGATLLASSLAPRPLAPLTGLLGHARRAAFAAVDELQILHPFLRREAMGETGDRPTLLR